MILQVHSPDMMFKAEAIYDQQNNLGKVAKTTIVVGDMEEHAQNRFVSLGYFNNLSVFHNLKT